MSYKIAVVNEKGGVAKTTTVVSLAGAFVEQGLDVLAIDLDVQANLTIALGISKKSIRRSITDVLLNTTSPLTASRETSIPGLDLIPATDEMGMAERFLPIRHNYQWMLKNALQGLNSYPFILMDCPPSLGAVTKNALTAANLLIIPTQAEYFSVHALKDTIKSIRQIHQQTNPNLNYRILITMLDTRNRIHTILTDQIQNAYKGQTFNSVIGIDTKLRESSVAGLPINFFNSKCRSTLQYRSLAEEITQYVFEKTPLQA